MARHAVAALALILACGATLAQVPTAVASAPAAAPSAQDFARPPQLDRLSFSPDGKKFAALEEYQGRMNIVVGDLQKGGLGRITNFRDFDVSAYRWISDGRLILSLGDRKSGLAQQRGGGLFAVNADGSDGKALAPTLLDCINLNQVCRFMQFVSVIKDSATDVIVMANDRNARSPDLYRLNTVTGRKTLITFDNPGEVIWWILDKDLVPRATWGTSATDRMRRVVHYRASESAPWRKVGDFAAFEPSFEPLAFGPDGTLYIASSLESDKQALYKFDAAAGKPGEKILAHADVDVGLVDNSRSGGLSPFASPLMFDAKTGELTGIAIDGDKPETHWFRTKEAALQKTVDNAMPAGTVNSVTPVVDDKYLVVSRSERDPRSYYLLDLAKTQLISLGRPRPWIKPEQMGTVKVVRYKSRDGLEIPSYLTLPPGKASTKLPLIVWVHGGPWARDDWGWDRDAQFFASRGYAVLQPNYRGSTGFGRKHLVSSLKQLGQSMQDDVTDGVRHLIAEGIVDPARVCIGGGSYGGYATMMGLVKEPDLFKCGINVVGVVDLSWWIDLGYTDFNSSDPEASGKYLKATIGDPSADKEMMRKYSPRLHADQIKAPVLIIHGGGDVRVPIAHAEGMRDALKAAGKPYEWLVFPEEGHGFVKAENLTTYYTTMEEFLAKHLGK
jgi:dipeptidyl aminopeptidase/acylaminoacyl peptidase